MKRLAGAVAMLLILAACGERATPDDQALHRDVVNGASGAEVTFDAIVLDSPVESGGHERFDVKAPTGQRSMILACSSDVMARSR